MTDYTIASPNGGTWTIQSTNSATVGRYHDLAFLMEGAAGTANGFKQARAGILVGPSIASPPSNVPGGFAVAPTSGLGFSIQPGAAVVERSTLVGPYVVDSTAVGAAAVSTADPSQTRIDSVDVQVLDGVLGDNGGVSRTSVKVTAGTPGGGLPAAPANSVHLGSWSVPAGCTSLAATGVWTPTWKSTCLRGGTRVLGPGDALADPGFVVGEERLRFHSTYGWLKDFWDPAANAGAGVWRGTQELLLPQPAQTGSGSLANGATATISSVVLTDPGWPYYVEAEGVVDFGASLQGTLCQVSLQIDSATAGTGRFGFDEEPAVTANINFDLGASASGNTRASAVGALTGSHTVYILAKNVAGTGGAASVMVYTNFYTFAVKILPALV